MGKQWDGPADTRMMTIVHDGLRRDLGRTRAALASSPAPQRRHAIAAHVAWMMDFLHEHHEGEDNGLYPMVRAADPDAGALLDAMAADHALVDPAVSRLRDAAARWDGSGSDEDRTALVTALDDLESVLLPHLEREERDAMPLVSATITHRQWHDWDQAFNIKPKSLPKLAEEGLWLLDGLDERRRKIVEGEVPWVPRQIILRGFGPGYRRRAAARWDAAPVDAIASEWS
jgi:hemerythrin-like domain-containing protein